MTDEHDKVTPERIWLIDQGPDGYVWCEYPLPIPPEDGESVEYVRADKAAEVLREAQQRNANLRKINCEQDEQADRLVKENRRLRDEAVKIARYVDRMLTSLQPHIPQSCPTPEQEQIIDNYVDPVIERVRGYLTRIESDEVKG